MRESCGLYNKISVLAHKITLRYLLGERSLGIVVRSESIDLIELVCLSETVPGPEVRLVDIDSCPITLDCRICVFHFQVLVAHQCPR